MTALRHRIGPHRGITVGDRPRGRGGEAPPLPQRVPMTRREQEVLATYVLGATVAETAAKHFIEPCTVRTHYRRVSRRYEAAGRTVANKAHLLLAMVADGRILLDGALGVVDPD